MNTLYFWMIFKHKKKKQRTLFTINARFVNSCKFLGAKKETGNSELL